MGRLDLKIVQIGKLRVLRPKNVEPYIRGQRKMYNELLINYHILLGLMLQIVLCLKGKDS